VSTYTDEQIVKGIEKALAVQDVKAVPGLIALLALQNSQRAESIRQTILLGLEIAAHAKPKSQGYSKDADAHEDREPVLRVWRSRHGRAVGARW
jgi:hypothetical protein